MNNDLYTEEFRDFKYLKSDTSAVEFFKTRRTTINSIQLGDQHDPDFIWPHVVEFVEQLLDLRNDAVYIAQLGLFFDQAGESENFRVYEIENPIVYRIDAVNPLTNVAIAELDDVPHIESIETMDSYFVRSENHETPKGDLTNVFFGPLIRIRELPIVPHHSAGFSAMFYNKETAYQYARLAEIQLRKYAETISTFTNRL